MPHSFSASYGSRSWFIGTTILALLALAGNYLNLEIFFGASFIFGSIAAILAIVFYGLTSGVIVALVGSAYTLLLFGHPYAIIVFTLEAAFIGVLYRRGVRNLVLADLLFWCTVGPVVGLIIYHNVIGMSWTAAQLILFKQALNGIFNSLIASIILLIISIYPIKLLRWVPDKPRIQSMFFIPILTTVLLAGIAPAVMHSQSMQTVRESELAQRMIDKAVDINKGINNGSNSGLQKIINLEHFSDEMSAAILDKDNQLLASYGSTVSTKAGGELKRLSSDLTIWLPSAKVPAILRWKLGSYVVSIPVEHHEHVAHIIIEQRSGSMVESLEKSNLTLFRLVVALMLLSILVAQIISHWLARPINDLAKTGRGLVGQIHAGKEVVFPVSPIQEFGSLSDSLQIMSSNIVDNFEILQRSKEDLEAEVKKRTEELEFVNANLNDRQFALDQHAIVSVTDIAGTIIDVNEKFCEVSGYSRYEMLGQNHRFIKSDQHSPEFYTELWETISQGKTWQGEICNQSKDGQLYWVQSTITPFLDKAGKPYQFIAIRTDITHVKAAEIALLENEDRISLVIESSGDGIWNWDMLNETMSFTRLYEAMLGYEEHELPPLPSTWVDSVDPEQLPAVQETLRQYLQGEIAEYKVEVRLKCKDGNYKWVMCRGRLVERGSNGEPVRMIGIHTDISDRKRIEELVQNSADQLNRAQSIAKVGSWEFNLSTQQLTWSKEHYEIFELSELPSEQLFEAFRKKVFVDDLEQVDRLLEHAQKTGEGFSYEYRIKCDDGLIKYLLATSESLNNIEESGQCLRGTVQDITERKLNEQRLISAREEADRANRAKSEFLSSMSHELRTPMNAILGFSQLLEMDDVLNKVQLENVQEIKKGGEHLLELINEVLDLAKIESGNIDLSLEPVVLDDVVEECFSLMSPLAVKQNISISHCDFKGAVVRADRIRLKQSLLNLISNAIKYNKENGSVTIDIKHIENNKIRVLVTDTGLGIAEKDLKGLFQPFTRVGDSVSTIEGTGIGLTITKRIIELMGGDIDVTSEIGVGSSFSIELPLEVVSEENPNKKQQADVLDNDSVIVKQHKILYIDDNPVNLKLVSRLLALHEHVHLLTAHTPSLGLELAETHLPGLILLDINMPEMNGYEVLDILKKDEKFKDVAVIAVSADAMYQDIERGMAAGFNEYVTKPIDFTKFNEMIARYISERD